MSCPDRMVLDRACKARRQSGACRRRECRGGREGGAGGRRSEGRDTTEQEPTKIEETLTEPKKQTPTSTLSWQDIVVVPRKAFLKGGRVELQPFTGVTINDNLIRHYVFGADINYFLTDALWVGV